MTIRKYLLIGTVVFAVGLTSGLMLRTHANAADDKPKPGDAAAKAEKTIREFLQQRVDLSQQIYELAQHATANGTGNPAELRQAQLELLHAKIDLVETKAERVRLFEEIVQTEEARVAIAEAQAKAAVVSKAEVLKAKLRVLEAKIALEEAKISE